MQKATRASKHLIPKGSMFLVREPTVPPSPTASAPPCSHQDSVLSGDGRPQAGCDLDAGTNPLLIEQFPTVTTVPGQHPQEMGTVDVRTVMLAVQGRFAADVVQ